MVSIRNLIISVLICFLCFVTVKSDEDNYSSSLFSSSYEENSLLTNNEYASSNTEENYDSLQDSSDYETDKAIPINDSICLMSYDIFENLKYVKSHCLVNELATWEDAKSICESNNMYLMRIRKTSEEYSVISSAEEVYGNSTGQNIWINARKNSKRKWISYENTTTTIMREYARLLWLDKAFQTAGDCMIITNRAGSFRFSGHPCSELAPFFCSYVDPRKL